MQIDEGTLQKTFEQFKKCICTPPFKEVGVDEAKNILDFVLEWLQIKNFRIESSKESGFTAIDLLQLDRL